MCRWLAYLGSDIPIEDVLIRPDHSLLDQSLLARDRFVPGSYLGSQFRDHAFPTNGDGFGLAWRAGAEPSPSSGRPHRRGTARTCATWPHN